MPSVSATALPPPHESHRPVWYPGALGTPDFARGALEAGGGLNLIFSRASGTSRSCHSLRNRAPGRWRHQGRSGAHATCWCSGARCTPTSVLLATGVELSMRMCEHLELIGAAAVGKIASYRQFPPFRFVLVEVLCYIPLRLEK